jgi:glutathione synthase/RimK-type ligase-like ATP-grasp enzyme
MILLWGLMEDSPLAAVAARLEANGLAWDFVDQRETLESSLSIQLGDKPHGQLVTPKSRHDISTISGIYWRQYDFEQVLGLEVNERGGEAWRRAAAFEEAMTLLAEHSDATVVNRPSAIGSNNSKPYQLELIRRVGLAVPETLISTEPDHVLDFWKKHGAIIYKSISSCRSIVAQFKEQDVTSLSAITCCPTQFQQYIRGTDYRVHVIGEQVFAHEILCGEDDYRYSSATQIGTASLPDIIAERCVRATRELGLDFAGVDLRRSDDGEWFCFEINPSPGFTYFDKENQVCDALAQYLHT